MIVAILATPEDTNDLVDLIFCSNKSRYVKFGFHDAKNCFKDILKNFRLSSEYKYTPFINIVNILQKSSKIVLVNDAVDKKKLKLLRSIKNVKIINVGCLFEYQGTDMYVEKMPKSVKEMTDFLEKYDVFLHQESTVFDQVWSSL